MERKAQDFTESGVINVNGQWATAVRFKADFVEGRVTKVALRFSNGRTEIASAELEANAARELLGARNFETVSALSAKAGATPSQGEGELRGKTLAFRQIALPGSTPAPENVVEAGDAARVPIDVTATAEPTPPSPGLGDKASPPPQVPAWVQQRFLVVGQRYYFPDHTLAFTDGGKRLRAETDNAEVVRGLIAIAELREWSSVKVSGSERFRQEVWRQATDRGIRVEGYEPREIEKAAAHRAKERQAQTVADNAEPTIPARPVRAEVIPPEQAQGPLTGTLISSGAASYRFDPRAGLSYYVKVATEHGERTLWGVDLERALVESETKVQPGDRVSIESLGSRPVTVKTLQRDADGKVKDARIATHRNRWLIEKPEYFEQRAERAAAFRNGQAARNELEDRYPDLTGAIVSLWLGEQFADRMIERPEDRERVVALVKERIAQALEHSQVVDAPRLKEEVRERLQVIGDDFDEMGQRARGRSAQRAARQRATDERSVPPQVIA